MKSFIFIIVLFNVSHTLNASDSYIKQTHYCLWVANVANVIVRNRDISVDKSILIKKYLEQGNEPDEQAIIIYLIDRIYDTKRNKNVDAVTLETKSECLGTFINFRNETFH